MDNLDKLVFGLIPFGFIALGIECLFNSEHVYQNNMRQLDIFAKSVKHVPILNNLAKKRFHKTDAVGVMIIKAWAIIALVLGLWCVYSIVHG